MAHKNRRKQNRSKGSLILPAVEKVGQFLGSQSTYTGSSVVGYNYYHERNFSKAVTFNRWVPMTCQDVKNLKPYKDIYNCFSLWTPDLSKYKKSKYRGPFFYKNHPINYVLIAGTCLSVTAMGTSTKIEVSDKTSTSSLICVSKQSLGECRRYLDKNIEIKGLLSEFQTSGIEVHIRDIHMVKDHEKYFAEATVAIMNIRRHVLEHHWICDDVPTLEQQSSFGAEAARISSRNPSEYCSSVWGSASRSLSFLPEFYEEEEALNGDDPQSVDQCDNDAVNKPLIGSLSETQSELSETEINASQSNDGDCAAQATSSFSEPCTTTVGGTEDLNKVKRESPHSSMHNIAAETVKEQLTVKVSPSPSKDLQLSSTPGREMAYNICIEDVVSANTQASPNKRRIEFENGARSSPKLSRTRYQGSLVDKQAIADLLSNYVTLGPSTDNTDMSGYEILKASLSKKYLEPVL